MRFDSYTAADMIWREKVDSNLSFMGGLIALLIIASPLMLL